MRRGHCVAAIGFATLLFMAAPMAGCVPPMHDGPIDCWFNTNHIANRLTGEARAFVVETLAFRRRFDARDAAWNKAAERIRDAFAKDQANELDRSLHRMNLEVAELAKSATCVIERPPPAIAIEKVGLKVACEGALAARASRVMSVVDGELTQLLVWSREYKTILGEANALLTRGETLQKSQADQELSCALDSLRSAANTASVRVDVPVKIHAFARGELPAYE